MKHLKILKLSNYNFYKVLKNHCKEGEDFTCTICFEGFKEGDLVIETLCDEEKPK
jgi:hypothetical protein